MVRLLWGSGEAGLALSLHLLVETIGVAVQTKDSVDLDGFLGSARDEVWLVAYGDDIRLDEVVGGQVIKDSYLPLGSGSQCGWPR